MSDLPAWFMLWGLEDCSYSVVDEVGEPLYGQVVPGMVPVRLVAVGCRYDG